MLLPKIVEAIHTDGLLLGTMDQMGTVDFMVNGGKVQPSCLVGFSVFSFLLTCFAFGD